MVTETVQHPDEACTNTDPAAEQVCLLEYLSEREYARATDPSQSALTAAFPVFCVLFVAVLFWKLAGH